MLLSSETDLRPTNRRIPSQSVWHWTMKNHVGLILIANSKGAPGPWGHHKDTCPANFQHTVSVSRSNLGLDIVFCLSHILCVYANSTCEHEQTAKPQGVKMGLSDSTPSLFSSLSFCLSRQPPHNRVWVSGSSQKPLSW